jgi:hypothetical protein
VAEWEKAALTFATEQLLAGASVVTGVRAAHGASLRTSDDWSVGQRLLKIHSQGRPRETIQGQFSSRRTSPDLH